jgi:retinol dehydrogenase 12
MSMAGKICVVTGANAGIGKATAAGLAREGATVVMACRNLERSRTAIDEVRTLTSATDVHLMELDLASLASIRAFARAFETRFQRLDVLVNNAGVVPRTRRVTADGFEMQLGVNHLGHFLLTTLLLPLLEASAPSRVVVVSSITHRGARIAWDDLQSEKSYGFMRAYGQSKLANLLFVRALAKRANGVTANAVHPGSVASEIMRDMPAPLRWLARRVYRMKSPAEGARTSLYLAMSPAVEGVTGRYFEHGSEASPDPAACDDDAAERLWRISDELTSSGTRPGGLSPSGLRPGS